MAAGEALRAILRPEPTSTAKAKFFVSPYKRCTETLDTILSVLPPDIRVGEVRPLPPSKTSHTLMPLFTPHAFFPRPMPGLLFEMHVFFGVSVRVA